MQHVVDCSEVASRRSRHRAGPECCESFMLNAVAADSRRRPLGNTEAQVLRGFVKSALKTSHQWPVAVCCLRLLSKLRAQSPMGTRHQIQQSKRLWGALVSQQCTPATKQSSIGCSSVWPYSVVGQKSRIFDASSSKRLQSSSAEAHSAHD